MDEIDTIGDRPQDPFYISEEDKKVMREELFPFWEGKSVDEYCEMCIRDRQDVSFHIYAIGELKTYSVRTLLLYLQDIHKERNPSFVIHRTTAEFYGYKNLDDAEQKLRTR